PTIPNLLYCNRTYYTDIYTLSLHDALPILVPKKSRLKSSLKSLQINWRLYVLIAPAIIYFVIFHYVPMYGVQIAFKEFFASEGIDRKSTRLNSSHVSISYAVFCLKKKIKRD